LKRLLPARPIVVGFDVDDTLIFSAPAFNALEPTYPADVIRPRDYTALTAAQRRQYHDFWNRLNEEYDDRSIPKRIGKQLLDLHIQRGDEIYIISRRQKTVPPTNTVTRRLERLFDIRLRHSVVQTNLKDKTPFNAARHMFITMEIQTAILPRLSAHAPCQSGCSVLPLPTPRTSRITDISTKSC
jgi:acid phosphatase (class B)